MLSERGMRLVQVTMRKDDLTEEADFEVRLLPFFSPTFSCQFISSTPQMFLCFGAQCSDRLASAGGVVAKADTRRGDG